MESLMNGQNDRKSFAHLKKQGFVPVWNVNRGDCKKGFFKILLLNSTANFFQHDGAPFYLVSSQRNCIERYLMN